MHINFLKIVPHNIPLRTICRRIKTEPKEKSITSMVEIEVIEGTYDSLWSGRGMKRITKKAKLPTAGFFFVWKKDESWERTHKNHAKIVQFFSFNVKAKKKIARIMERERELTKGGGMVTELQIWRLQRFEIGGER